MFRFVMLSEAKNLFDLTVRKKNKERFFASLRMTAFDFPRGL
jgi:hypothetical protein